MMKESLRTTTSHYTQSAKLWITKTHLNNKKNKSGEEGQHLGRERKETGRQNIAKQNTDNMAGELEK